MLASLVLATAAVMLSQQATPEHLVLISLTIIAAGLAAAGFFRMLSPLAVADASAFSEPLTERGRAALEREKMLVLRSIKEIEFDKAMGKISAKDFDEMAGRLRTRAIALIKQLDEGGSAYRDIIERELSARLAKGVRTQAASQDPPAAAAEPVAEAAPGVCKACGVANDDDARFCKRCGASFIAGALVAFFLMLPVPAVAQPDVRQMSGMPLPVADVAPGTVSVRVVKGALTNVITNQAVTLIGAGDPKVVVTNESGRAEFTGLTPGTRVRAVADIAGERLESQEFQVPSTGGIRLLLVATDPAMAKQAAEDQKLAQAPAQRGTVVLGEESRLVIEMGDDGLNVFNILQIVNEAKTPVQTEAPLVFIPPANGEHVSVLEGSSPQAVAAAGRVTVTGPFAPGPTVVQFAYTVPLSSGDLTIQQTLPIAMKQLTVLAQKVGAMHLTSPQFSQHRDMASEGQTYVLGHGPALKAGDTITLNLTGLPHEPAWPRNLAVALAIVIIGAGAWASVRARRTTSDDAARVAKLQTRRDRVFAQLAELEERHRGGHLAAGDYQARRRELISALEEIYAEIDHEAAA